MAEEQKIVSRSDSRRAAEAAIELVKECRNHSWESVISHSRNRISRYQAPSGRKKAAKAADA